VDLADEAIDPSTHVPFDLEHWAEEAEVHQLVGPLEVLAVVPLDHAVF